jgi:hypothetical protein
MVDPKLFPAMESLVGDIPAGDGNIASLFYSVAKVFPLMFSWPNRPMILERLLASASEIMDKWLSVEICG